MCRRRSVFRSVPRFWALATRVFAVSLGVVALTACPVLLLQNPFPTLSVAVRFILILLGLTLLDSFHVTAIFTAGDTDFWTFSLII